MSNFVAFSQAFLYTSDVYYFKISSSIAKVWFEMLTHAKIAQRCSSTHAVFESFQF